jgi:membrane protease YdiL (CAAX protease family)
LFPEAGPASTDRSGSEPSPSLPERIVAFIEVLLCSDYLTQFTLGGTFAVFGYKPFVAGTTRLSVRYVVALSLGDAVLLVALMLILLYAHGERPREVFLGRRPLVGEILLGLPMTAAVLVLAAAVLLTVQRFAPSLHTVPDNPLQELLRSPRSAWVFALVVLVAGGVREELQRAFLLHRFERYLGGARVGVVVTSVAFGAGHLLQGVDAAIATGLLGAFWAGVYLWRRSVVAPMISHTGFDLLQILSFVGTRR